MNSFGNRYLSVGWFGLTCLILVCIGLTGCGNNLAQVSGAVTVDGQPLRGGGDVKVTVCFQPEVGGVPAVGLVDAEGIYTISTGSEDGIAPGAYLVTCSGTQIIRSPDGGTPSGKRITDPKYANAQTSGLRFSVKEGDNQYDISMESPKALASQP